MDRTELKRRVSRFASVRLFNPLMRRLLEAGLVPRGVALLETTGRTSGQPRRVPVGDGLRGDRVWIVAEHVRHMTLPTTIEHEPPRRSQSRISTPGSSRPGG